jgi:3-deoxy-D-manno-octulosonic-acid transferase
MELEVWPNFVHIAKKSDVPVIIVNGRISNRSFSRYKIIKPFVANIFRNLSLILAQTDEYAQRFIEIGATDEKVIVTGSLKYDTAQITDKVDGADTLATELGIKDERLWVAGATGNDEEKILLDVYQNLRKQDKFRNLRLAIIPRKPERFNEVAQLIEQQGLTLIRYSLIKSKDANTAINSNALILGDTMGDLRKFYSLATVIFVGRSLVPMGGSDMMEAAALGKCTLFGPYAFNFKQAVDELIKANGAIMVKDAEDLLWMMQKCLLEPEYAKEVALKGREVIWKNQGATARTIKNIAKFL